MAISKNCLFWEALIDIINYMRSKGGGYLALSFYNATHYSIQKAVTISTYIIVKLPPGYKSLIFLVALA